MPASGIREPPSRHGNGMAMNADQQRNGPSLSAALEHITDVGRRIISDEIGLAKLETQERVSRNMRAAIFIGGACVLGLIAWVFFMVALYFVFAVTLPPAGAAAVVG